MGFVQESKKAGLDLENPEASVDIRDLQPNLLARIMNALRQGMDYVTHRNLERKMSDLLDEYHTGVISKDWKPQAVQVLRDMYEQDYLPRSEENKASVSAIFDRNFQQSAPDYDRADLVYDDYRLPGAIIRDELANIHTMPELRFLVATLREAKRAMPEMFNRAGYGNIRSSIDDILRDQSSEEERLTLKGEDGAPVSAGAAYGDFAERISKLRNGIVAFSNRLDDYPQANSGFRDAFYSAKSACERALPLDFIMSELPEARKVSKRIDQLFDSVKGVQDIWRKMEREEATESEKRFKHKNSPEYEEMRKCVEAVNNLAGMLSFHPDNATAVKSLEEKMEALNKAAVRYAEKKAVGFKRTSMGIERKNSALALIQLTNPKQAQEFAKKVTDLRMSKDDKKQRSFAQLIEEEREANREKSGRKESENWEAEHHHKKAVSDRATRKGSRKQVDPMQT
ncbi:MAG: hypothetical protein K5696_00620 [Lachnospiraceae bacterium]|nr:hypothetical protein [Lachnospiraceae bacterium]